MPARISDVSLDGINRQLGLLDTRLTEVAEQFDALRRGALAFSGDVDLGGNRLTNTDTAQSDDDALTLGELLERLDDLEDEGSQLETSAAEDYAGGGRQKRLLRRTSRLKDQISDEVASTLSALGFPGVVFTQDDGAGNAELAVDTANFVWDDTNNRLGLGTATPTETLHVSGGNVRIDTLTAGSVLFAGVGGVISQDNANLFWDDTNNRLGILDNTPANTFSVGATSQFQVGSDGDVDRLKDVPYSWPAAQGAASTILSNDGAGVLSWSALAALGIVTGTGTTGQVAYWSSTTTITSEVGVNPNSFTWDAVNNRLGIQIAVPTAALHVVEGTVDVIQAFSGANELFSVGQTETTFNENGLARDLRVESDTLTHALFVNGTLDQVGVGTSSPNARLGVVSTSGLIFLVSDGTNDFFHIQSTETVINDAGLATHDVRVEGDTLTNLLFIDASADFIGINQATPTERLHVVGNEVLTGTLYGGTSASDDLVLESTSNATKGFIDLQDQARIGTNVTANAGVTTRILDYNENLALSVATAEWNALTIRGSWTSANLSITGHAAIRMNPTITPSNAIGPGLFLLDDAVVHAVTVANSAWAHIAVTVNPSFTISGAGTFNANQPSVIGVNFKPSIGAGITTGTVIALNIDTFSSTGTVNAYTGVLIADIGADAAANGARSLVSAGAAVEMRHAGPAIFGQNAAPTANTFLQVAASATSSFRNSTRTIFPPTANQVIDAAADTILANSTFVNLTNTTGAPIVLTSAPTIADGEDGMYLIIMNIAADSISLQDQGTLAGSNLRLGAIARVLGTRDSLILLYSSDIGDWVEVGFNNVI